MPRNRREHVRPERICGDPLECLCERVVIEVPRVFDGCVRRVDSENFIVRLDAMPAGLEPPFVFLDLVSEGAAVISDIESHRVGVKSRITCTVNVPVKCRFRDNTGREAIGYGALMQRVEVMLFMPEFSNIKVRAGINSSNGAFLSDDTVSVNCCYEEEFTTVGTARLMIPVYDGFEFPECGFDNPCFNALRDIIT